VLSPGPCTPNEAGCSLAVVRELAGRLPILGICLGHQAIGAAFGGNVVRASEPVHGRTSKIFHDGKSVFAGMPSPIVACRYHSLVVNRATLPAELEATAWTADDTVMALAHRELPIVGLQFHPESILTDSGYELLAAFLRSAGIAVRSPLPSIDSERAEPVLARAPLPAAPVTF
jgi:anthranilate synthase/aminodeoxychorismate synthase-like glutamine amidotransferase